MIKSIDRYLTKKYDASTYNCAHLVAEAWQEHTGVDIKNALDGFLLPPKERYANRHLKTNFKRIEKPCDPCIVLMHGRGLAPHVGIFIRGKVLQIRSSLAEYTILNIATRGFTKVGFYKVCKI